MRLKLLGVLVLAATILLLPTAATMAQGITVEAASWNAQITAHNNSNQLDVQETQNINVTGGTLHGLTRDYTVPVNISSVAVAVNGGQLTPLTAGNSSQPGTYQVSNSANGAKLNYELPKALNAGENFTVQINLTTTTATQGVVDWNVVPGSHPFPVRSSTLTITFPDGQAPNTNLVRVAQGIGNVSISGNTVTVQSQGTIAADQSFEIQSPFGVGVGAPANTGNTNTTTATTPASDTGGLALPGIGTLLLILCGVGLLVLIGGGTFLRGALGGLLGGFLGGRSGGLFGGGQNRGGFGGGPIGGGPTVGGSGRGFRDSANQNREIGPIGNDKQSGGGESLH